MQPTADIGYGRFQPRAVRALRGAIPGQAGDTPHSADPHPWQGIALAEITNFATLRRQLGRARADLLTLDLIDRAAMVAPALFGDQTSRNVVEFDISADTFEEIRLIVAALEAGFAAPFMIDGAPCYMEIVLAAAGAPIGTTEDVRLAESAEGALDEARSEQRTVIRDLSVGTPAFDRLTLTRELPAAIANGEMFLHYQPKVHVRRQEIASVEALVRWQHPQRGLIPPGDFITVAEETYQIAALTRWTLMQVIHDQRVVDADGRKLTFFINMSGMLLSDAAFVDEVCDMVVTSGARIGFEITETAVIRDPQSAIANLRRFADVGIVIAIDDYGAGLSSLAYLKQLPACELKIDKMFILHLTSSNRDPLIVRSTIDLAHALDMEVTAEGVETQAAMALLSVMGCDIVQGYLISRPVAIDAFRQFLCDYDAQPKQETRHSPFGQPASFWKRA